jgi:hypothetical protein
MKSWTVDHAGTGDEDGYVITDANLDLPTLNLELVQVNGFYSPADARRLAMVLNSAADYAESCVKVGDPT